MSQSDNLLNRLRQNRQRTTVPIRDDSLVAPRSENQLESQADSLIDTQKTFNRDTTSTNSTLEELKTELAKFPETQRHSAIVLEKELDQKLTRFCKDQGVTVETFLEAAWEITSADEVLLEQILAVAKRRYISRKEAGRLRRLITMLSKT